MSADGTHDWGRFLGLRAALLDEFNCYGKYSDAAREQCVELNYVTEGHMDNGAFKVPSLRNVADTSPYFHDGRFSKLGEVIDFYMDLPPQNEAMHEIPSFKLSNKQKEDLGAFLSVLSIAEAE
jgi:cytochrome c peroxidase